MILAILVACREHLLVLGNSPELASFDTGGPTTTEPSPIEVCNGEDDDDDGAVDEGYPDADDDGVADCVDPGCGGVTAAAPEPLEIRTDCGGTYTLPDPIPDAFDIVEAWRLEWSFPSPITAGTAPLVVFLDDDDGDGVVGAGDGPEIVLAAANGESINIFAAADGTLKRTLPVRTFYYTTPAVADGDGDGVPEIYTVGPGGEPLALDPAGRILWQSTDRVGTSFLTTISVVDLEGDGAPEVLVDALVLDAATGATLHRLDAPEDALMRAVSAADLDADGISEILLGGRVFGADGALLWQAALPPGSTNWMFPVQADGDPEPEVVFVGTGFMVLDGNGAVLAMSPLEAGAQAGAPTAADFDGDGVMEVGVPLYSGGGYTLFELDGSVRWSLPDQHEAVGPGSTAFDFQGDGSYEILLPTSDGLEIRDGTTGTLLVEYRLPLHTNALDLATVADVDEDGHADVIVGTTDGPASLTVLRQAENLWPPAGPRWTQYDFTPGAPGSDGEVPVRPDPPWLCPGVWRAWPAVDAECGAPDLVARITDVCVESCVDGPALVAAQVGNQGAADAESVTVTVAAHFGAAELSVARFELDRVPAGGWLPGIVLTLPPEAGGATGYTVTVDPSDPARECDPAGNRADWFEVCG